MRNDLVLVVLLISILALMVIPLPSGLIDVLLTVNISLSVMLLMVAVYLKTPIRLFYIPVRHSDRHGVSAVTFDCDNPPDPVRSGRGQDHRNLWRICDSR